MRLGKGIVLQLEGTSILRQLNIHFLACLESYCDFSDMSRPWEVEKNKNWCLWTLHFPRPFRVDSVHGITTWPKHKATPTYWCLTLMRSFFIAVYPTMMLYSIILCRIRRILNQEFQSILWFAIIPYYPPWKIDVLTINPIKNPISILLSHILSP